MKIADLIKRDMVVPALEATEKKAILEELAAYMAGHHNRIDRAPLARVLVEREQLASPAIGEGVAIPHGKLGAVSELVACLGRAPVDDSGATSTKIRNVGWPSIESKSTPPGAHLKALARI